jgi:hypothetical protein
MPVTTTAAIKRQAIECRARGLAGDARNALVGHDHIDGTGRLHR